MRNCKVIKILFSIFLTILTTNAIAVEGYKNFKFGMNTEEVIKIGQELCSFRNMDDVYKGSTKSISHYGCEDFVFLNGETMLFVYIVKGKLLRIGIRVPEEKIGTVFDTLKKKYVVNKEPSQEEKYNVYNYPGHVNTIHFEESTVLLRIASKEFNGKLKHAFLLMYTDPNFEKERNKAFKEDVDSDL